MIPDLFDGVDPVAQSVIRAYCGWHIAPKATEEVVLDGSGTHVQHLPTLHLVDLASLVVDGQPVDDPQWSEAGMVRGHFPPNFRSVRATMIHGHAECPAEIRAVASRLVGEERIAGLGSVRIGQVSVQPMARPASSGGMDPYVASILDRYRIPLRP